MGSNKDKAQTERLPGGCAHRSAAPHSGLHPTLGRPHLPQERTRARLIVTVNMYEVETDRIKGRNFSSTVMVGDFNAPLSVVDRTTRQKVRKQTEDEQRHAHARSKAHAELHPQQHAHSFQAHAGVFQDTR